jgi:hypothetical protein
MVLEFIRLPPTWLLEKVMTPSVEKNIFSLNKPNAPSFGRTGRPAPTICQENWNKGSSSTSRRNHSTLYSILKTPTRSPLSFSEERMIIQMDLEHCRDHDHPFSESRGETNLDKLLNP